MYRFKTVIYLIIFLFLVCFVFMNMYVLILDFGCHYEETVLIIVSNVTEKNVHLCSSCIISGILVMYQGRRRFWGWYMDNNEVLSGGCVPGTVLDALYGLTHLLIVKTLGWYYEYPQFIDEETETQSI